MSIGKDEVLEVLSDFRIHSIRFSAGPIHVNVEEYDRVGDFIESGAIDVKPTASQQRYVPQKNALFLNDGNSRTDFIVRSGILHECTHVIADINKVRVSRLHDEAAAYMAQLSFHMLLDPSYQGPSLRGDPISDLTRVCISLVTQYHLGQSNGFGAVISASDLATLGSLVQRNPEYSSLGTNDQLAADGVGLSEQQAFAHVAHELARRGDRIKYEVALLEMMSKAQTAGAQKSSAYQQLRQHFLMIYQPTATVLLHRLSALIHGDLLSERFHAGFTAQEKQDLLSTLRMPKPPG
jgi:hypothetical protein